MTPPSVYSQASGHVLTIVLARPEKRNAVDRETANALRQAFTDFEADDTLKVAVLWGEGGNFCAGADLSGDLSAGPELSEMIAAAKAAKLKLNNADQLNTAADKVGAAARKFSAAHDGGAFAGLDSLISGADKYKGKAVP